MTEGETETLIKYHCKMLIQWVGSRNFAGKDFLLEHAERITQLVNQLPEDDPHPGTVIGPR